MLPSRKDGSQSDPFPSASVFITTRSQEGKRKRVQYLRQFTSSSSPATRSARDMFRACLVTRTRAVAFYPAHAGFESVCCMSISSPAESVHLLGWGKKNTQHGCYRYFQIGNILYKYALLIIHLILHFGELPPA